MSVYEIRVQGHLDRHWATWFEGLTLTYEGDTTVLSGVLADEAALHGVLTKVGNLNLHLLSVKAVDMDAAASMTRTTATASDPSVAIGGREPAPLDAPPSVPLADTPVPERKRQAGAPRKRPQKRRPP